MNHPQQGLDPLLSEAIIRTIKEPLIVLDGDLRVIVASSAFYDKFQIKNDDARGKLFYELSNGEWDIPALRTLLEQVIPQKKSVEDYQMVHTFKVLGERVMVINAKEINYEDGQKKMLLSFQDVTDRTRLMGQKDTLLKEMRHRIANSLQLIASIILLKAESVQSEESKRDLEDAHDRILSIATVQRNLDPTGDDSEVPIVPYLQTLCESIGKSMIGGRKPIRLSVEGDDDVATPDNAIALGLITTELVINALKHAFPGGEGNVEVRYKIMPHGWQLCIKDNGVGLAVRALKDREGLGTNIIDSLATQLEAEVTRASSPEGLSVFITHPRRKVSSQ